MHKKSKKCKECGTPIWDSSKAMRCSNCYKKIMITRNMLGKGKPVHQNTRNALSKKMASSGNPMWKGDSVGIHALHEWVKKRLPKKEKCEICLIKPSKDLSNRGIYNRELKNWWWLCRKCHMEYDGTIEIARKNLFLNNHKGREKCLKLKVWEKIPRRKDGKFTSLDKA